MDKVVYFVSYDLIKNKDYQILYDELSRFRAKRVLESVWCLRYGQNNSMALRDYFRKFIDSDDRLLVIESIDWAGINLIVDPNKV